MTAVNAGAAAEEGDGSNAQQERLEDDGGMDPSMHECVDELRELHTYGTVNERGEFHFEA